MRRSIRLAIVFGVAAFPFASGFASENRHVIPSAGTPVSVEALQMSHANQAQAPPAVTQQSYGCALVGGTAAGLTAYVGAEALLGGLILAPVAPALATAGLAGVAFVAFCNVGQRLTPATVAIAERIASPPASAEPADRGATPLLQRSARLLDPAAGLRRDGFDAALQGCATSARCMRVMEMLHMTPRPPTPSMAGVTGRTNTAGMAGLEQPR
jgi:hypothetical protein